MLHVTPLFESPLLKVRHVAARPQRGCAADLSGAPPTDLLLMPMAGVFAHHDGPRRQFIANSNHALLFPRHRPYRMSFPGGLGDDCLVFEFSAPNLRDLLVDMAGITDFGSPKLDRHGLLAAPAMLGRDRLWRRLGDTSCSRLAVEEASIGLLAAAVHASRDGVVCRGGRDATLARRRNQAEAVKEAISMQPEREWSLSELARHAHLSTYHLTRVFREQVGLPVHQYLLRARLGRALERLRQRPADLTAVALESGFSSHSHFSASFRACFGTTPAQFRQEMEGDRAIPAIF